ncbi:MAG: hypothetical protein ACD_37C00487G0004 [uncultured bacterium]|nr:MAG: hypothetical protein ACD_37C00487G0004 [uncultured bacterium]KKR17160.1 MAG: hypothetical protein UT46_C0001G0020 [Candidatus Levybacteria bacterium GW2011_GWA1_39_34]KKR73326.1 MAG: hypothetical protein UU15_C0012G0006 [Candidatus Levybacteria bacterium GW2011_GWC2_40_7]KKS01570.1 MAG: hypothetical protein UU52_C0010G0005 [Candidatus Levybacteria bacterium GW2011_GWB1_41_21]OGH21013.1 MAG: hypothetical protein A2695_02400 [Candidatus Levybacteria bacterium RIFCSPHIGHO2_01_FULL_40_83]O
MNRNKIAIESLSMDLLRVALGYHRGSNKMTKNFLREAKKRVNEVEKSKVKPYFVKILKRIPTDLSKKDTGRIAEDALMYSNLCRNYAKKFL